jgi:hypothetical protein
MSKGAFGRPFACALVQKSALRNPLEYQHFISSERRLGKLIHSGSHRAIHCFIFHQSTRIHAGAAQEHPPPPH